MGRKKARDSSFKCIYQFEFYSEIDVNSILSNCYVEDEIDEIEKEYIEKVVKGVLTDIHKIDEIILGKLKNWTLNRISKIDLAILRLASYEILYTDTPVKVVANEAVELAKTYGNDDSSTFVNGVIAKVIESKG